jgi:hypothetical protein
MLGADDLAYPVPEPKGFALTHVSDNKPRYIRMLRHAG